jgi:hypothetical protein
MRQEKHVVNELDQSKILVFWFASTLYYYRQNTVLITSSTEPINLATLLLFLMQGAVKSPDAIPTGNGDEHYNENVRIGDEHYNENVRICSKRNERMCVLLNAWGK